MGELFVSPQKADGGCVSVGGGVTCGFELQAKCPVGGFHAEGIGLVNLIIWVIVGVVWLVIGRHAASRQGISGAVFLCGNVPEPEIK